MHDFLKIIADVWKHYIIHILDICIVAFLLYKLLVLIHETRALQVLKGLIFLFVATFIASGLQLHVLTWLLKGFWVFGLVTVVIVFQPELRSILARIGRGQLRAIFLKEKLKLVEEIIAAVKKFSKKRTGALIVLEQKTGLKNFVETGIRLNAEISSSLLDAIFMPGTALHDGAIIIRNQKVIAAKCLLPLTFDSNLSKMLGTRHRAAVGLSEVSDALVIVVSEETGSISVAKDGHLMRDIIIEDLQSTLKRMYKPEVRDKRPFWKYPLTSMNLYSGVIKGGIFLKIKKRFSTDPEMIVISFVLSFILWLYVRLIIFR